MSKRSVESPQPPRYFFTCPETSLVISNMLTLFLPLNTAFKFSSALIWVRTFLSCNEEQKYVQPLL